MLLQYLNWPRVPLYFHEGIYRSIQQGLDWHRYQTRDSVFQSYLAEKALFDWLTSSVQQCRSLDFHQTPLFIQVLTENQSWHKDSREWAINYIIDSGGDRVSTVFKDGDQRREFEIEPERWHILPYVSRVEHTIEGIKTKHISLTLNLWWRSPIYL
jgi:hypothetical protein